MIRASPRELWSCSLPTRRRKLGRPVHGCSIAMFLLGRVPLVEPAPFCPTQRREGVSSASYAARLCLRGEGADPTPEHLPGDLGILLGRTQLHPGKCLFLRWNLISGWRVNHRRTLASSTRRLGSGRSKPETTRPRVRTPRGTPRPDGHGSLLVQYVPFGFARAGERPIEMGGEPGGLPSAWRSAFRDDGRG